MSANVRIELWGGPHDGLFVEASPGSTEFLMPVLQTLSRADFIEGAAVPTEHRVQAYSYIRKGRRVNGQGTWPVFKFKGIRDV